MSAAESSESAGASQRCAEAVRLAYEAYYRRLVVQVFGLTGDLADAQDAVQEAFARVLVRPGGFLAADDPETWLRTVALNVARTQYRRRWVFDRLVRTGRVRPSPDAIPGMTPDRLALVAALRLLPRSTREAVVLHHVADLTVEQVAAIMDVPVGTVKARLSRGRAALGRHLAADDDTPTASKEFRHV
jgi:RNA polymerase sigma factor (sigma-70 family)